MKFVKRHKRITAIIVCAFLGAAAYGIAAWITASEGGGAGKIGSLSAPTVAAGTAQGTLVPGGTGAAVFQITNNNSVPLLITSTGTSANGALDTGFIAGCTSSNVIVQALTGLSISVPVGTSTVVVPNEFMLASSAPSGCQGISFTRGVSLNFST
jgi:hypothetical protein